MTSRPPGHPWPRPLPEWQPWHQMPNSAGIGLDIISVQLTQQSTVSKERTKFRPVDDIEKRGQHRALRKAMRAGTHWDVEDPRTTQRERPSRNEASQVRKLPDKPKDNCKRLSI